MRFSNFDCGLWALVVGVSIQGCANRVPQGPNHIAPGATHQEWRAPVVLRPGSVTVNLSAPTRQSHAPGLGKEVFWLSVTALLTFGVPLLDLPNVVERNRTAVLDLPPNCSDHWKAVTNRPQWLGPAEARHSALKVLEDAMKQELARRGQALTIEMEPAGADDPHGAQALTEIGERLHAPLLAVADVSFGIEPQPSRCAMLMRVSAHVHSEQTASPSSEPVPPFNVSLARATPVSVMEWGPDPEVGGQALRTLLGQLGNDIVAALQKSQRTP